MADQETASDVNEDVAAKLKEAAAGPSESSTEETKTEQASTEKPVETATEESKDSKAVPYDRFKEVNENLKQVVTSRDELQNALKQAQQTSSELTEVVKRGQQDADLIASLRGLNANPKYADLVQQVDRALQGLDLEEEKGDKTPEQVSDQKHDILVKTQTALQEEVAAQKNEVLLQRADMLAKDYMSELPADEFLEVDKNRISEMWANRLNWDEVRATPDKMADFLKTSLEETLKDYGDPTGRLVTSTKAELEKATEAPSEAAAEPSIEDRMGKYLGKNFAEVKDGKLVMSDEEFSKTIGGALKELNKQ